MPVLLNPRWESFAKLTATGSSRGEAYRGAGFKASTNRTATRRGSLLLRSHIEIQARVTEIETELYERSLAAVSLDRERVIKGLLDNITTATEGKPRYDEDGNPTGERDGKVDLPAANRAWELLGKELGMFKDRLDIHTLDHELDNMTGAELIAYVKALVTEVGMRVVDQTDDEKRSWIFRNAPRLGLVVTEANPEDASEVPPPERLN